MSYGVTTPDFPADGCAIVFGASGGLGNSTAGLLAERGANVVATYRSRPDPVNGLVENIRKMGRKATAMQCDVMERASIEIAYHRRWFSGFTLSDNRFTTSSNYARYGITAPSDPRLPDGGGYRVENLFDIDPSLFGRIDNLTALARNYGEWYQYFNGLDITLNVRTRGGLTFQGGTSTGQVLESNGELLDFDHWSRIAPSPDDDAVRLVHGSLRAPRVLHLVHHDRVPRLVVRLTRQNLMLRDHYQCQYCGKRPGPAELNLDHVIPRSRGGIDSWENLVVSCRLCNIKKGKKTPKRQEEEGEPPRRKSGTSRTKI